MDFEEFLHVGVGVDETHDGAFPARGGGQVQETEEGHLEHEDPEEYGVDELDHEVVIVNLYKFINCFDMYVWIC